MNKELMKNGLWNNNPAIVQLLGLCPLLAVSATVTNALGLGLATTAVLIGSNLIVSLVRQWVPSEVRIPVFVMIIAALVTCVQLLMNAYTFGLYQSLGIFIPLIVTNCIIIGRAEAFASKNDPLPAVLDGLWMGLGMTAALVYWEPCVKCWVTAPCLTVQIACWVTGHPHYALKSLTLTAASCWRSCHRVPLLALAL
ncbi:electron transport complex protein RnfE [Photobacterium aphoticum]|uniref:Electron transport complex protein RnfE n=1 Tax=Photobacterium aphoticum TaxID=754436 RepID=A0A090QXG3_9GAMM|nr:electron transport complex protein RnfE [Photobacterium aphoticum]